jgi:diguanylate cyclase (GGDEF)-like protein
MWAENSSVFSESVRLNQNRTIYCALISIPINLVNILQVLLRTPLSETEVAWQQGVILGNGVMLLSMVIILLAALWLRRAGHQRPAFVLSILQVLTLFIVAGALTAVDQLITTNITPFVLACLVAGALFIFRPVTSAIIFTMGLTMFVIVIDRGGDPDVLLSNRINGLAAAGLGFGLSLASWRHLLVELRQRRQIEAQSAELERVNRELEAMAYTDSLTGLPNRRYFDQAMARELAAIERGGKPASVIEFDLDFFKNINDSLGHIAGDEILRQVAALACEATRKADLLARYGGEEFILLLPDTPLDGAATVAENLRRRIASHTFRVGDQQISLTGSFGVVEIRADTGANFYRAVDRALYRAKQKGRNRIYVEVTAEEGAPPHDNAP